MSAHKFQLETRGDSAVLICSDCSRPFLDIINGQIRIKTKHGSKEHDNFLTEAHLKMIAIEMWRQQNLPGQR